MTEEVLVTGTETNDSGNDTKLDGATAPEGSSGATKPEGDAAAAEKKVEDKPQGVPEKYDFKLPEGVKIDEAKADSFSALCKKAGLSQEAAQEFLDSYVAETTGAAENAKATAKAEIAKWASDTKALPELGGENLPKTIALANKAVDLGPPELKAFLKGSGLGNHPLIVRWAHAIGAKVAEDKVVQGGDAGASRDAAKTLFPNQS